MPQGTQLDTIAATVLTTVQAIAPVIVQATATDAITGLITKEEFLIRPVAGAAN